MKNTNLTGNISLVVVGILFGLSGIFAKYLSTWMNAYQTVALRFGVAFVIAVTVLLATKQKFSLKKIDSTKLLFFVLSFPAQAIFFTLSVFHTKVALAVFAFYIANLLSSFFFGYILFKEKIDTRKGVALLCIVGSLLCFTNPFQGFNLSLGFMFGLIAGVVQTISSIFQKTIGEKTNRLSLLIAQTFSGTVMAAVAMFMTSSFVLPMLPVSALVVTSLFGAIFLLISYLLLYGFQRTNLNLGTLLISSELLFGPVFAFVIFRESLGNTEILGGVLATVALFVANSYFSPKKK
jgi:drug/metabolite transporter (DMT)-like permease